MKEWVLEFLDTTWGVPVLGLFLYFVVVFIIAHRYPAEGVYTWGDDAALVCGELIAVNDNADPVVLRRRFEALLELREQCP